MCIGYSVHHTHDVYRILNIGTKKVINSQHIVWLNQVYHDWKVQKMKKNVEDDKDETMELKVQATNKDQEEVQEEKTSDEQREPKFTGIYVNWESSYIPKASKLVERIV
jgi:hypothetical protein